MIFVETKSFTRQITDLFSDDDYSVVQGFLETWPVRGALVPGSGGLRKLRWQGSGRGKRGGVRLIYYWVASRDIILMLDVYPKSQREDLTQTEVRALKRVVEEVLKWTKNTSMN